METKICKVCGNELPISEFRKSPLKPNGIDTCKKCCTRKRLETKENKALLETASNGSELSRFTPR